MKMLSRLIDPDICVRKIRIGQISALVLSPRQKPQNAPGVLWIHGGGYFVGMKEMIWMSRAVDLVKKFGAVVVAPGYRLAIRAPYPAALIDCYGALRYMKIRALALGINEHQLMVGGESAGGGLTAAVCMLARDLRQIKIAYQMPLYPMLSNIDTKTSEDNHGKIWNTRLNHIGWKLYLRGDAKQRVSSYASPAAQTDYRDLPPAYTFVGTGEPFYQETMDYIDNLKKAGVEAKADVYVSNIHAFDMLYPNTPVSQTAISRFEEHFAYAVENYFA